MKDLVQTALVAGVAALSAPLFLCAEDSSTNSKKAQTGQAFLGVYVETVHPALANNLRDLLSPEQGLIVEELAENSPAAKAGIKAHDILTTYDDQKLFSAEQLAKLVHSDRPGREVAVAFLRGGKLEAVRVKLGEAESSHPQPRPQFMERMPRRFGGPGQMMRRMRREPVPTTEWENFDSLTLKKLKDDKFRAEVQYLDKEGKARKHVFEGTREEIRKSIESEKDLKPAERAHLLRSLGLHSTDDEFWFPNVWFSPGPAWFYDPSDAGFE